MKIMISCVLLAGAALAACTSGGESVAGIDARGGPTRVSAISSGSITGFGSIIVNGVHYNTANATISVDGVVGTESDLKVGQVVVVQGSVNDDGSNPVADTVSFDDVVEGPISAIDTGPGTITVLGQIVIIDADTSFDDDISPASIDGLAVNDIVEVSGFILANGSIAATRIETKPAGGDFEATGLVSNLGATTFMINNLVVDFSAAQLDDFPAGAPENGQLVEAKGNSLGGGGELIATRVEFKGNNITGAAGVQVEVEGFITRFASASDFDVDGVSVITNGSTVFENGTAADLALNRKVEVEGVFDAAGTIVASKVEIKLAGFLRFEGTVEATTASSVTLFGIEIKVNQLTRLEDKSVADVEPFRLADIVVGDYLETRGYEDATGIVATRIEREDFGGEVAIRAFVDAVNDPNFTIQGVPVETNGGTVFRDLNDQVISSAVFFGQAMARLVEAEGSPSNGGILADEVELED